MFQAGRLLEFAAVAAVAIAIPGPSVLFTISRALTTGRRTALLNVLGNEAGLVMQVIAVAFGMGVVVERSAQAFTAIKLLGGAYLVYLGVQAIRHRRSLAEAVGARTAPVRPLRALSDGMMVGALNPKSAGQWLSRSPRRLAAVGGTGGLVMIGLGVSLAATGRKD